MALPKQVEQHLRDVEELEKQLQAPAETGETAPVEPPPDPVEPPAAEVTPTQPVAQESEDWQQKYNTLIGKYNAEVPRLHQQLKELAAQLESVQKQVQAPPPIQEAKATPLVTDQDREAFGEDLIDLQRRVAREVAGAYESKLDAYESKIAALEQRLMQTGNQVGEMTFEQRLHRVVPDFDEINGDPRWIAWLDEVDPILRAPRRTIAQQAYANGDVEGVAHYVNLFRGVSAAPQRDVRKAELERQVAPTRASSGTAQVAQQGKTYSMQQWNKLFDQAAMMKAQGKSDEGNKLEAELTAAMTQGRVTA